MKCPECNSFNTVSKGEVHVDKITGIDWDVYYCRDCKSEFTDEPYLENE